MRRRATLAVILAAGALLAGLALPAHADEELKVACSNGSYELTATAYYRIYPPVPTYRQWLRFEYRLKGGGNQSNVNIVVRDGPNDVRYDYRSPDNRRPGTTYYVTPERGVFTYTGGPFPNDRVSFEGIFDRRFRSDPRCTAHTVYL